MRIILEEKYYEKDFCTFTYDDRKLTEEELAVEMGVSISKLREIVKIAQERLSLETPIGKEEDSRLGDFIEDKDADAPVKTVAQELLIPRSVAVLLA